jgi:chromosome segregation protein
VLAFETAQQQVQELASRQQALTKQQLVDQEAISKAEAELAVATTQLEQLQQEVKALGEDQLIAVQAELAGLEASGRELARQAEKHQLDAEALQRQRHDLAASQGQLRQQQQQLDSSSDQRQLDDAEAACRSAEAAVELSRRRLGEVAGRSGSWLEEQKQRSQARQTLSDQISPLEAERQQLGERLRQNQERLGEVGTEAQQEGESNRSTQATLQAADGEWQQLLEAVRSSQQQVQELAEALALQQRTRSRLEQEQTNLERDIARLDSRRETLSESRGTGALRMLLEAGLEGIHGPVAQLGDVDENVRMALEVAAGGRLGQVVVDDDRIAAKAIELLKSRRAGRLTFLPLNKIRGGSSAASGSSGGAALQRGIGPGGSTPGGGGLVGKAVDLVRHEPVYAEVFRYVFGDTLVFDNLANARRELGRCRAVTLDGELLEKSGAMTGGSLQQRGGQLSFGSSQDGDEAEPLRRRLLELGESLLACRRKESELGQRLETIRPQLLERQQRQAALEAERSAAQRSLAPQLQRQEQLSSRLVQLQEALKADLLRQKELETALQPLKLQLTSLETAESAAQASGDSARWQGLQAELEAADQALALARRQRDELLAARRERALAAERLSNQLEALASDEQRLVAAVNALVTERTAWKERHQADQQRRTTLESQQSDLQTRFGERRRARDAAEAQLGAQRQALQQQQWEWQRLGEELLAIAEQQRGDQRRLEELERELPDPLPEIPDDVRVNGLDALQNDLRSLQARMEALEPVNMLALEELEQLEARLADLEERLDVLSKEREELLLRIETVATLRQEAFMEAFTAVDGHFREIFAGLSDGEGHLQLENPEAPLEGGLTLVAHPKGKAVRRLNAMSGGEKSLTALSFLFALQRFRPSPFYALDEVDSFLDGVNVERLAALIASQADQAQFMVVSHRRPMIAAATRTIGVTQARGAHTQVVGLPPAA